MELTEEEKSIELRKFAIQEAVKIFRLMGPNVTAQNGWSGIEYLSEKILLYCKGE